MRKSLGPKSQSNTLEIYNTLTAQHIGTYKGHGEYIKAIAWKEGDHKILTSSDTMSICWDTMTGEKDYVFSVSFLI